MSYEPADADETLVNKTLASPTLQNPSIQDGTFTNSTLSGGSFAQEVSARSTADTTEASTRAAADTTLTNRIAAEETNRAAAITSEATARSAADAALQPLDTDLTSIANLVPYNDDFIQRKGGTWTNRTVAQVKSDLNLATDTATALTSEVNTRSAAVIAETNSRVAADSALQADINTRVLKSGDRMTGTLYAPTVVFSDLYAQKSWAVIFAANTANQKFDVYTTSASALDIMMDITVVNKSGLLVKRFSISNNAGTIVTNESKYADVMGSTDALAISDVTYDSTTLRWRFKIIQRVTSITTMPVSVTVRTISNDASTPGLIETYGVSSVYTTDSTVYPPPVLSGIAQVITNAPFIRVTSNYSMASNDGTVLAATAGITITLPTAVGIPGRELRVKNISSAMVTVAAQAGQLIDNLASVTVAQPNFATASAWKSSLRFMSDGANWWIMW